MEADAAFFRPARDVVLHTVAREHFYLPLSILVARKLPAPLGSAHICSQAGIEASDRRPWPN